MRIKTRKTNDGIHIIVQLDHMLLTGIYGSGASKTTVKLDSVAVIHGTTSVTSALQLLGWGDAAAAAIVLEDRVVLRRTTDSYENLVSVLRQRGLTISPTSENYYGAQLFQVEDVKHGPLPRLYCDFELYNLEHWRCEDV